MLVVTDVIRKIGRGGFGLVEEVELDNGQHVARKTFALNQPFDVDEDFERHVKQRFSREVSVQESFTSPNIVRILESNLYVEPPYFLMPLAESSLDKDMKADRTLGGKFLQAMSDIIAGLEEIHSLKIYHRDLKPQNVLRFSAANGEGVAQPYYAICDFGLVAIRATQVSGITPTGMRMGSDYYTAPEITADLRKASEQSDIFSLGCILHDFVGTRDRVPCNEIKDDGPYAGILLNCTRADRARRFKSASAVRDALLSVGHHLPTTLTTGASEAIGLLDTAEALSAKQWLTIIEFLDDRSDDQNAKAVLRKLTLDRIQEVCTNHPELGARLGIIFANWVRVSGFVFDECDGLANRLEYFVNACDIEVQAEALMAMLIMGTSHNRWYVERKFMRLAAKLEPIAAKRLAIEFRANDRETCSAVRHLERSIGASRTGMHEVLVQTLGDICG